MQESSSSPLKSATGEHPLGTPRLCSHSQDTGKGVWLLPLVAVACSCWDVKQLHTAEQPAQGRTKISSVLAQDSQNAESSMPIVRSACRSFISRSATTAPSCTRGTKDLCHLGRSRHDVRNRPLAAASSRFPAATALQLHVLGNGPV